MKKRFTLFFVCTLFAGFAMAQKPTAVIKKASEDPVIDGWIESVWDEANVYNVDQNYTGNEPTLGPSGTTTWQGLWTDEGIWILVVVNDDAFLPWYAVDPPGETWQYDKTELYFDVNYWNLEDGGGPLPDYIGGGNGHYQIEVSFADGLNDGTLLDDLRPGHEGIQYAFMVNDPDYIAEYYLPYTVLVDGEGGPMDPTQDIGFDVYIVDRDPDDTGEQIAVWANTGTTNSAWNDMDDCGIITFEGAVAPVYIDGITLTGGEITENNGTLQIVAEITPENATETVVWSVAPGDDGGKASISSKGVVTAIIDGTVTVICKSTTGYVEETVEVAISNQIVTMPEINLIRNGYFDRVDAGGLALEWEGSRQVVDGHLQVNAHEWQTDIWATMIDQQKFGCNTTDPYWFTFVAWADESDTINVDFEDVANDYARYGTSSHELSNGTCDWTFVTEVVPTKYTFDVIFGQKIESTIEQLNFFFGHHEPTVYIDSVILYNENDLAFLTEDYTPVESIKVTSEGGTVVPSGSTLQLNAEVLPENATLREVRWSVEPGSGYATIDENGLLTGDSIGTVTAIATAKDDSRVWNKLELAVTWPEGIEQYKVNTLRIYPNPAVDELNVVLGTWNGRVSIYNSSGQKVEEVVADGIEHRFDISGYAEGVYFVKSGNAVAKFIK